MLSPFWGLWDQEAILGAEKAKFRISSIFYKFSLEFSLFWVLKLFDSCDLGDVTKGAHYFVEHFNGQSDLLSYLRDHSAIFAGFRNDFDTLRMSLKLQWGP